MSAMLRVIVGSASLTAFEMLPPVPATDESMTVGSADHFDRFGDRRDLQLEVDGPAFAERDLDPRLLLLPEPASARRGCRTRRRARSGC